MREALGEPDARLDHWEQTLVEMCRIPTMSASGFPPKEVRRSAQAVAQTLQDAGSERHLVQETCAVRHGGWQTGTGEELCGKVLGILGLGNIGREVARTGHRVARQLQAARSKAAATKSGIHEYGPP